MREILRMLLSVPKTPQMKMVAFVFAGLVLALFANTIREAADLILWPWIVDQYGLQAAPFVHFAVWVGLYLIIFLLLNMSFASSFGMLVIYGLNHTVL